MIGSKRKRYRAAVDDAVKGVNPNKAVTDNYSSLDRVAIWMTGSIGTMKFTIVLALITVVWIGYNWLAPKFGMPVVDELPALVVYLLAMNVFATVLMPLLMVGQNMQARQQEAKAEQDYINNETALRLLIALLEHLTDDGKIDNDEIAIIRERLNVEKDRIAA